MQWIVHCALVLEVQASTLGTKLSNVDEDGDLVLQLPFNIVLVILREWRVIMKGSV